MYLAAARERGFWRDRIAVDDQRLITTGTQSVRGLACEIERGTRIRNRKHDVAFGDES